MLPRLERATARSRGFFAPRRVARFAVVASWRPLRDLTRQIPPPRGNLRSRWCSWILFLFLRGPLRPRTGTWCRRARWCEFGAEPADVSGRASLRGAPAGDASRRNPRSPRASDLASSDCLLTCLRPPLFGSAKDEWSCADPRSHSFRPGRGVSGNVSGRPEQDAESRLGARPTTSRCKAGNS